MKKVLIALCCVLTILLSATIANAQLAGPDWRYNTWLGYGYNTHSRYVQGVQVLLIDHGYSVGSAGADGYWGTYTNNAVKSYQSGHGLTSDGIVGSGSWQSFENHLIYVRTDYISGHYVDVYKNYGTSTEKWNFWGGDIQGWAYSVPPNFNYWEWFTDGV